MKQAHGEPSVLGGEREGVVLRLAQGFSVADFQNNVCKSVRFGHVQTDEHWTRKWKPCRIERRGARACVPFGERTTTTEGCTRP